MPDKGIWHYLPKVYQDLWLALEEADARPSADSEAERLSFAEHLAAMTADTDSMQPGLSPGVTEAATSRKAPAKQKVPQPASHTLGTVLRRPVNVRRSAGLQPGGGGGEPAAAGVSAPF